MGYLDNIFRDRICYTNKLGVKIIIQLSQGNGKLPLPQLKYGTYPLIPIYEYSSWVLCPVLVLVFTYVLRRQYSPFPVSTAFCLLCIS